MFLLLTEKDGDKVYINEDEIRQFYKYKHLEYTVLELRYGTKLVKERPEEIAEMLRGE